MVPPLATVALAFILGSTHPRYGSSLAFAGLPHTNEHLCDHVFIIILLTAPKPLCESLPNVGAMQSDINPRATVASIQVLFRGTNVSIHTRFALHHAHGLSILHY